MALIDPPQYVTLPPVLVYGAGDLGAELRLAAQQIAGWMWVTKRHGRPLGTTTMELAQRWGVAERTAYWRLAQLVEKEYFLVRYARSGGRVYIEPGPAMTNTAQHTVSQNAHTQNAHTQNTQTESSCNPIAQRTDSCNGVAQTPGACAMGLHKLNTNTVVGVVSDSDRETGQQQQTTIDRDALDALLACGLWEQAAANLAADPWVTVDRIERTVADLIAQEKAGQTWRTSRQAVLRANLQEHREPPLAQDESDRRRFIEGEYADYIEH